MEQLLSLFVGTFTTLLAVVNPLEALPVFLSLSQGKDVKDLRKLAFRSCLYALILIVSFLVFGTLSPLRKVMFLPPCYNHHSFAPAFRPLPPRPPSPKRAGGGSC